MKKIIFIIIPILFLFIPLYIYSADYNAFYSSTIEKNEIRFIYLEASGVVIRTSQKAILIDPGTYLKETDIAQLKKGGLDLVLFTHNHYDHYNYKDAKKIFNETGATVIAESQVARQLKDDIPKEKLISGYNGESYKINNIIVNVVKGIHIGEIVLYQIKIGDITIFHGGDSDYVPLTKYASDIAFIPTGSPSPTCSPKKAFKMAKDIKPKVAVAMHGAEYQHKDFEKRMKEKMARTKVIIPTKGNVIVVKTRN